jgi:hypothetical protein
MRTPPRFSLLTGSVLVVLLAGCAATSTHTAATHPTPAPSSHAAPAPPAPVANATPKREPNGQLVTLADLTGHGPTYGQTESLADSTPGEVALSSSEASAPASSSFENLEIVSPSLRDELSVLRVGSGRSESNLLSVFAGVKNKTAQRLNLEMQTVYRDKDGHPLGGAHGSWVPITLKPHEETQYRSVALSEDATDFLVRIRPANENSTSNP